MQDREQFQIFHWLLYSLTHSLTIVFPQTNTTLHDNTDIRPSQALQGVHIKKLLDAILPLVTQYSKTKSDIPLLPFY